METRDIKSIQCPHCAKEIWLRKNYVHTPETFKDNFKVGDHVSAWSTNKVVVITAIGNFRFFAINIEDMDLKVKSTRVNKIEHPYSMFNAWRKINEI